jgi:hypothetical protein
MSNKPSLKKKRKSDELKLLLEEREKLRTMIKELNDLIIDNTRRLDEKIYSMYDSVNNNISTVDETNKAKIAIDVMIKSRKRLLLMQKEIDEMKTALSSQDVVIYLDIYNHVNKIATELGSMYDE